jgi:hypothetical protein
VVIARAGEQGGDRTRVEGGALGEEQLGKLSLLQAPRVAGRAGRIVQSGETDDRVVLGDRRDLEVPHRGVHPGEELVAPLGGKPLEPRMAGERADELGETGPWQRPGRREMQSYRDDTEIEEGRVALDLA